MVSDSGSDDEGDAAVASNIKGKTSEVEDIWVSDTGSDENVDRNSIEDIWESDGNGNGNGGVQLNSAISAKSVEKNPEDDWVSASDTESDFPSSQPTVNSQMMVVSQSRITLPTTFRQYGPEDFSNLQDHMFEDKLSDSEDSEE